MTTTSHKSIRSAPGRLVLWLQKNGIHCSFWDVSCKLLVPGTPPDWAAPPRRWCPGLYSLFRCPGPERGWPWSRSDGHLWRWCLASAAWPVQRWWCHEGAALMWGSSRARGLEPPLIGPDGEPPPAQHSGCGTAGWIWFQAYCGPVGGGDTELITTTLGHTHTHIFSTCWRSLHVCWLQVTVWLTAFPHC